MGTKHRIRWGRIVVLTLALTLPMGGPPAWGQGKYPDRPIDFICNWGAGGGADQMARILAQLAEGILGVALPVTNVPGASGNTGLAKVVSANPDGYTISTFTSITLSAWIMGVAPYKIDDFEWVARTQNVPSYLFVKSDSPIGSMEDFVRIARERGLKIATAGYGTNDDVAIRFLVAKGLKLTNVPFAKPAERYAAPLGGHVDALYEEAGDVKRFLEAKQIRPIMVFAKKRNPVFPDVPASYELGYPVAFFNWRGVITKRGTPPDRVKVLASAFTKAMESPKWKEFCKGEDCQPDSTMGSEEFRKSVVESAEELLQFAKQYGLIKK